MSNLYKYSTVVCPKDEKKVIDSNAIISEKIVKLKEAFESQHHKGSNDQPLSEDKFSLGINAEHVEGLLDEEYINEENSTDEEKMLSHSLQVILLKKQKQKQNR